MLWSKTNILGAILFIGCASAHERAERIFSGNSVLIEDYPYQASLRGLFGNHICGGSIISEQHILTAAHCINKMMVPPFDSVYVVTGTSYTKRTTGNHHLISKIDVHPGWVYPTEESSNEPFPNDLAVITLKDKIVFDKYQQKIDLPHHDFEKGHQANVTGWGLTSQFPQTSPNQLEMIETKLVSPDECQKELSVPGTKVHESQFCAFREHEHGVCFGDSGGPVAADGKLVGIISWVDGDFCGEGLPEVYTNVYKFKDYIENIMKSSG